VHFEHAGLAGTVVAGQQVQLGWGDRSTALKRRSWCRARRRIAWGAKDHPHEAVVGIHQLTASVKPAVARQTSPLWSGSLRLATPRVFHVVALLTCARLAWDMPGILEWSGGAEYRPSDFSDFSLIPRASPCSRRANRADFEIYDAMPEGSTDFKEFSLRFTLSTGLYDL
jgi:hypothetical protein